MRPKKDEITPIAPDTLSLSGRTALEDLADYGIHIPDDEVDTIGGYLCLEAGHVPCAGEAFAADGWLFTVEEADLKQILRVTATKQESEAVTSETA